MSRTERYNFNSFEVTFCHEPLYQLETQSTSRPGRKGRLRRGISLWILINLVAVGPVGVSQISQHVKTNTGLNVWFHLGAVTNLTDNLHKWPLSFSYQITALASCLRWHQGPGSTDCNHLEEEKYHKSPAIESKISVVVPSFVSENHGYWWSFPIIIPRVVSC